MTVNRMNIKGRLLWALPVVVGVLLYFPLNYYQRGGIAPATAWDSFFTLWPVWVIPYMLTQPFWMGTLVYCMLKMDERSYRETILGAALVVFVSVAVWTFFPTFVNRPVVTGSGIWYDAIRWLYHTDHTYNALPSLHVSMTMFSVGALSRWRPRWNVLWWFILVAVSLSTLFTRQHYLLDVVTGLTLGGLGLLFGPWAVNQMKTRPDLLKTKSSAS
jgi:membrane-associated phospholipid phosphatase